MLFSIHKFYLSPDHNNGINPVLTIIQLLMKHLNGMTNPYIPLSFVKADLPHMALKWNGVWRVMRVIISSIPQTEYRRIMFS